MRSSRKCTLEPFTAETAESGEENLRFSARSPVEDSIFDNWRG